MGVFDSGGQQLRNTIPPELTNRLVQDAASRRYTGELPMPGQTLKFENGNLVAIKKTGQTWKKFAITAAALVGGGIALGSLGGPAATAATASGSATAPAVAAPTAAAVTPAAVAPVVAKGASLWSRLATPLLTTGIQAATNLYGTKMQVDAQKQAAETAAKAAEEALAWQKDVYGQRQRQLAPAIGVGNASTVRLGELMGLQTPEGGYAPPPSSQPPPPAQSPTAVPRSPSGAPDAFTPMRTPDGRIVHVPTAEVATALQRGGQIVE